MAVDNSQAEWCRKPLGEVAPIDTTAVLPTETPRKDFFYVALENVESGTGRLIGTTQAKGESIKSNKFQFGLEHVLLGKLRPYLNKVFVPDQTGICSTDILPLKPQPNALTREFLAWCLRSPDFVGYSSAKMEGGKMPRLRTLDVECYEIPVPPLTEQRRIVARVEALTRRLDQARQARQAALAEAETVLASAVGTEFLRREETGWEVATVVELCGKPQYGYTESASREAVGPKFLRITDIQNGRVNWPSVPYCVCKEVEKYRLERGDILFARTGATTGKSYLVTESPEAVFASYLIRIRPGKRVLPEFLWWYFQSQDYWGAVETGIDDGNRPNMNGSKLGELEIPFPTSRDKQRAIVARLDALRGKLDALQRLQREVEAELASFTPALLAKAFRGEL